MAGNESEFFKKSKILTLFSGQLTPPMPPTEFFLIDTSDNFFISTDGDFYIVDEF